MRLLDNTLDLSDFHNNSYGNHPENDVLINRNNQL